MADEPLPLPVEIQWKLVSTTQGLANGEPAETSISLFVFEPDEDLLTSKPDEKLVYVKVTATVSPAVFPASVSKVAASFLGEGIPCFHVLLDLKVRNSAGDIGTIRPYFQAAAPLNRRMIQTGVIGGEAFEGDAESQSFGKSGSQVHESLKSHSNTTSFGGSAGFGIGGFSIGASASTSSTDVSSSRNVSQVVDSTSRQASEERRELVSYSTKVENVLTLLSAKYVGTPHLRWSLMPQPLQLLSIDPSDPNLWFQQLLARRSSGIEGIQEFTAVVAVPRDTEFCISARMRRVCLLDSPPSPSSLDERLKTGIDLLQLNRMVQYLNRTFPPGTPLEDLDIDILAGLSGPVLRRPVVELWGLRLADEIFEALVVSPSSQAGVSVGGSSNYKHWLEVWQETVRDEFERELARSPLERGMLVGENRTLDTCFALDPERGYVVKNSNATVSPLFKVDLKGSQAGIGGSRAFSASASIRSKGIETATRWNAVEAQLANMLSNRSDVQQVPLTAKDPDLMRVLIDAWSKLSDEDARNVGLKQAAPLLNLDDATLRLLKSAGVTDLKGIGAALKAAPGLERHDAEIERMRKVSARRKDSGAPLEPLKFAISSKAATGIAESIGAGLSRNPPGTAPH